MPTHGIKLDLEFLGIVVVAGAVAYYVSGSIVSNALFTALISVLFFLIGLHLDIDSMKKCAHHKREVALGWAVVFILAPLTAFGVYHMVGGALGQAFIAIGVSSAAMGSPVVFSNLSKGKGELALIVGGTSLLLAFLLIPLLLTGFDIGLDVTEIAVDNLLFLAGPLALGIFAQRFENVLFDDLRHHFSKVGLWLIILVMLVQFRLVYNTHGLAFLQNIGLGAALMAGFVLFTFGAGYFLSRVSGFMEPEARALGFASGSKGIAIALFIASQMSGEAVMYVSMFYFIRQGVTGAIMEWFRRRT